MRKNATILFILSLALLQGSVYHLVEDARLKTQKNGTELNLIPDIAHYTINSFLNNLTTENTYSTYTGGSEDESMPSVVVDSTGNVWVVGATTSDNFPTTPDAYNATHGGSFDIFVQKFNSDDGELLYSTFVGGSSYELAMSAKIDFEGNLWVCGETGSTNFPTTPEAYSATLNGSVDMFLFKLAGNNGSLLYSSFLGGSDGDSASSISLDSFGNPWITGITFSSDFPTTPNALYPEYNTSIEAVICKISKNGSVLLYSTYMGGSGDDYGHSLEIDNSGNIWFLGQTSSSDFPTTQNAYDDSFSGVMDIYLCKMSENGSILLYSSFLGGTSSDSAESLNFDSHNDVWVTGSTNSGDFPTTNNAYDDSYGGSYDSIVFKIAENGSFLYSSFFGGTNQDYGRSLTIDSRNSVWITGDTSSVLFPTTENAFNRTYSGSRDSYLLSLTSNGTLQYSSFIGGSDIEVFSDIAFDTSMKIWIAGETDSINFPSTINAFNNTYSGNTDIYLISLTLFSVPDAPEHLDVYEAINRTILLTWNPPVSEWNSPVIFYRIYRSNSSGEFDSWLTETQGEYYVDSNLQEGINYYYVITAVNKLGESSFSKEVEFSFNIPIFKPTAPQNLEAILGGENIYLYWEFPSDNGGSAITNYSVYRRATCGLYNVIGSTVNSYYNDTSIQEGIIYFYYVTASNSQGESDPSNIFVGTVPDIIQPTIYHLEEVSYYEGVTGNNITWISFDKNPSSFRITRNNILVIESSWDGRIITFNVDFLTVGTYIFNCTVIDITGNSASDIIIVTVHNNPSTTLASSTSTTTSEITTLTTESASGLILLWCVSCLSLVAYRNRNEKK